jgi:D-inositol-3-phosphate glycosyltransferase
MMRFSEPSRSAGDRADEPSVEHEVRTQPLSGLRIGLVTHYMPPHIGGIERLGETLFQAYTAAGADVRWVASRAPRTTPCRDGGRIRVACWNGLESRLGVPWPVWGPAGVVEVGRLAQWADVLHVHDCLYIGSAAATITATRLQKPVVLSQHVGLVQYSARTLTMIQRLAYRTLGLAVLRRATRVVCCTPAATSFVTRLCHGAIQLESIPNGVDTGRFHPSSSVERRVARQRFGLPESDPVVLFVGRLVEKKGTGLFLEVARCHPRVQFLMIGDGPLKAPVSQTNLRWLPRVPPADMVDAYHAADVLLLPSEGEGFPFAVIEAMAAGVPVICSANEEYCQLLGGKEAAFAVERTPGALADALVRALDDSERTGAVARRARDMAVQEFGLEVMAARYGSLLLSLVHRTETRTMPPGRQLVRKVERTS